MRERKQPYIDLKQNHRNKRNRIENPPERRKTASDGFRSNNSPKNRSGAKPQKQEKSD